MLMWRSAGVPFEGTGGCSGQRHQFDEGNGPLSFQSIFQIIKQGLFRFSGVIDAMGRKPAAAVLHQFYEMLEKLGRPAIPGANDHGARNDQPKYANPGPAQTAPAAMLSPAPESTPDPGGIDIALWDHGIDGLLQERVPVDSDNNRSGSGAFWAAAFLASGLVVSELNERPRAESPSARKPRLEPRE
jgi:hypothetical protein